MSKIHYWNPQENYKCPFYGVTPQTTSDMSEVTCKYCLGGNKGGRPPKPEGSNKVQIVLTDRAFEKFQKIKQGKRSKWISNLIIQS